MRYSGVSMSSKVLLATLFCLGVSYSLCAQDTAYKQTIQVTSTYKPHLRNTVKIDLVATPLNADTSRPRLAYNIPAQNLFFSYNPVVLAPLSLAVDSTLFLGTRNYVKAGFGSFTTPYFEGALGFGDGKSSLLRIYGDYISSRGKIKYQDFSNLNIKADGSLFTGNNEAYASFGVNNREYYQYGFDHNLFDYSKDELRRSFRTMNFAIGFRNTQNNNLGINYDPHIELYGFSREKMAEENTLIINLPAEKMVGDDIKVKVAVHANVASYKENASSLKINNSLFQVAPAVSYSSDIFNLNAGLTPSWNNGESALLPNIYGEFKLEPNVLSIQGGWVGSYRANSYRTLSNLNPFMADPVFLHNTKETQYYGGIKASVGGHFNFNAKLAFIMYKDMPLFVNDDFDQRKFLVLNESHLNNLQLHGDMNYIKQDKFSITAGLDLNSYSGLKDNSAAWGLYPLKISGSFRWNVVDQLILKGDVAAFSGAKALLPGNTVKNLKGGTDLSAGVEYKINKMFSAWLDINNLLNSKYEYWYNYPVYGLQVIGGVIVRF